MEYYEAIVDAAVHPADYVPDAGAPAPIEQDGWEDQAIVDFVDASDHISYGSIHGVESEFDDPFIDAILNRDRAVQIGDWLIKLDLTRGKVFTIAAELPNAYQDLLGENSTTVRVFSMEEDVLAILRGESGTAQPGGGGVGGIDEDDLTFRAYLGGNVYAFRVEAMYHRYGIYFKIFARMRVELETTKAALAERKVIDRAKGLLMKARGLNEDEAYALLRKTAMDQSRKVADVAEALVTASDLLG